MRDVKHLLEVERLPIINHVHDQRRLVLLDPVLNTRNIARGVGKRTVGFLNNRRWHSVDRFALLVQLAWVFEEDAHGAGISLSDLGRRQLVDGITQHRIIEALAMEGVELDPSLR